jgi:cysteinyl-tRNA synthetase
VEFSFEALDDAATSFRRIEAFLERAGEQAPADAGSELPAAFAAAMDDDLGTPAAIAVIHDCVREGNRQLADGRSSEEAGRYAGTVRAMLDVLGLDPADPAWPSAGGSDDARLSAAVDSLVAGLLAERTEARAAKDWARADAIRDTIAAAGIDVEDTPDGPKWSLSAGDV